MNDHEQQVWIRKNPAGLSRSDHGNEKDLRKNNPDFIDFNSNEDQYLQIRCHSPLTFPLMPLKKYTWVRFVESGARTRTVRQECCSKDRTRTPNVCSWTRLLIVTYLTLLLSAELANAALGKNIARSQNIYQRSMRSSPCPVNCITTRIKPVCASDRRTYASKCHVRRLRKCLGKKIRIKHRGECKGVQKATPCLMERKKSIARAHKPSVGVFIPKCTSDGSYAPVQCHAATGYCWCVDTMGMPTISSKQITHRKTNCNGSGRRIKTGRAGKRLCTKGDRRLFNKNIIRVFEQEYKRDHPTVARSSQGDQAKQLAYRHKVIVDWKFTQLDRDSDNKLKRPEVRYLRRLVKKMIKPRSCARTFANYCDLDQDHRILRKEWSLCLGVDTGKERRPQYKVPPVLNEHRASKGNMLNPNIYPNFAGPIMLPNQLKPQVASSTTEAPKENFEELPYRAVGRCEVVRDQALRENAQNPAVGVFIPACTPHGEYQKAQCHQSSQVCWCVNQASGNPIMGTSTHGVKPTCDIRHMKGCPHSSKRPFLTHLMAKLIRERYPKQKDLSIKRDKAFYDEMVRWKFKQLDDSGNRVLERKEWKKFKHYARKVVRKRKELRKCGRNFLRYCDADSNRRITLAEWIDCTGVQRNVYSLITRRPGKNPLEKFLRES